MNDVMAVPMADVRQRRRVRGIRAAAVRGAVGPGLAVLYLLATLDQPRRMTMLAVAGLMLTMAAGGWCGARWVARSRIRIPVQLAGAAVNLVGSAVLGILDGGVASPLGPMVPLSLTFLAIVTPPRIFAGAAVLSLGAYWSVVVLGDSPPAGYTVTTTLSFGGVAYLCLRYSSALASLRRRLAKVSRLDPLTGCLNRRGFDERLAEELATGAPVTLALVDLDRFKEVNDTYGHRAGDDLLVWVARTIKGQLRAPDAVGRLGGDEFAVILSGTGPEDACAVVERLRAALDDCASGSIGHAGFPADGTSAERLALVADQRLYADKAARDRRTPTAGAVAAVRRTVAAQTPVAVSGGERRRHSIADAGWMSVAQSVVSMVYLLFFTAGHPQRFAMAVLVAVTAVLGFAVVVSAGWLARSPAARYVMLGYAAATFCNAAVAAWLDGTVASAFGIGMLASMPLIMLAMRAGAAASIVAGVSLAYVTIGLLRGAPSDAYVMTHLAGMLAVAAACALQGRAAARQRALLTQLSGADVLTGCLNRRGFGERFTAETAQARPSGRSLSLLLLDLDGFKQLNDAHGHAAGDQLLCWVTDTLRAVRPHDVIGRLGGDEFVVLVGDDNAAEVAATLRTALAERTAVSIGTAEVGVDGEDFDALYAHADALLYEQKADRHRLQVDHRSVSVAVGDSPAPP